MLAIETSACPGFMRLVHRLTDFQKSPTSASMLHIEEKAIEKLARAYLRVVQTTYQQLERGVESKVLYWCLDHMLVAGYIG